MKALFEHFGLIAFTFFEKIFLLLLLLLLLQKIHHGPLLVIFFSNVPERNCVCVLSNTYTVLLILDPFDGQKRSIIPELDHRALS